MGGIRGRPLQDQVLPKLWLYLPRLSPRGPALPDAHRPTFRPQMLRSIQNAFLPAPPHLHQLLHCDCPQVLSLRQDLGEASEPEGTGSGVGAAAEMRDVRTKAVVMAPGG